jgi:hypothetical protein
MGPDVRIFQQEKRNQSENKNRAYGVANFSKDVFVFREFALNLLSGLPIAWYDIEQKKGDTRYGEVTDSHILNHF